ncbi:N-acetyl-gamma-glutamyl-phosphate reductase [Frankliniella fusca]|uniref:N-acetyl-gamma-glutamyl-phosphate reductase n=1 Tax=Frankliniella fusca TaxID=407009 RepID=A0AAE1HQ94_9NEOP|nr:N-acetyl-gamma-glutamyl-phosphate reductase [Frankliniella fusca]
MGNRNVSNQDFISPMKDINRFVIADVLKELLNEVEETNKLVCRKRPASDLTDGEVSTSAFPIKVVKIE